MRLCGAAKGCQVRQRGHGGPNAMNNRIPAEGEVCERLGEAIRLSHEVRPGRSSHRLVADRAKPRAHRGPVLAVLWSCQPWP